MSFTAYDIHEWLDAADQPHRLLRSDGAAWTSEGGLARRRLTGAVIDSRLAEEGKLFVAVKGERHHGAEFLTLAFEHGATAALVENRLPAVEGGSQPVFLVEDGKAALAALASGWLREHHPTVVGITGSNGKTTTKDMARVALQGYVTGATPGNLNSSYGVPLAVLGQEDAVEVLVLEMGASAPGEIASLCAFTHPRIGCITNIAPAHLEAFGTVERVVDTKADLLRSLHPDGCAILPADDPWFSLLSEANAARRVISFGRSEAADVRLESCRQEIDGLRVVIDGVEAWLPLFGEANGLDAAAACAIARALDVPAVESVTAIAQARYSPHRSRIFRAAGRIVLDDLYNANPASMIAALESLAALPVEGRRIAVLGSMAELGGASTELHRQVVERAERLGIDRLVGVGRQMRYAMGLPRDPQESAVELGAGLAQTVDEGDAVLFKASRSMQLERVLGAFLGELGVGEEVG